MKQKGFAPILLLIGILAITVIGATFYFITTSTKSVTTSTEISQPTPSSSSTDENANWQDYTSSTISFSYPKEFGIAPTSSQNGSITYNDLIVAPKATTDQINKQTQQGTGMGGGKSETIVISTFPPKSNTYTSDKTKTVTSTSVTVSNQLVTQYTIVYQVSLPSINSGDKFIDTVITYNGITYTIELLDQQYLTAYNHLLSTFKFTDQNSSINTSSWKTYTDNFGNFSIKFPPEYQIENHNGELFLVQGNKSFITISVYELKYLAYDLEEKAIKSYYNNRTVSNIIIDKASGIKNIGSNNGVPSESVIFKNSSFAYEFGTLDSNSIQLMDSMLNTFKFTN